jgi:hypothetical protein
MGNATRNETSRLHRHRVVASSLVVLGCLLTLAACGSAGTSTASNTAARSSGRSQFLQFSECMRSHGVANFPDPSSSGGIQISAGSGVNPFSPAFKAAQSVCRKLLPGGGPGGAPSAQAKRQLLAIAQCMRAHGVPDFPDPTTTPPSSPAGYSQVLGRGGVFLAVPNTIDTASPAYTQAAAQCRFGLSKP